MSKEFDFRLERTLTASPEEVWAAVATGPGNLCWLYPMEVEPWVGGVVSRGPCTVTAWEPPRNFACHRDDEGFSLDLSYVIEPSDDNVSTMRTSLHWLHQGTVDSGWDMRTVAATEHAYFFHHTLGQYLSHFKGRTATYVNIQGPATSSGNAALTVARRGLAIPDDAAEGDSVSFALPGGDSTAAVVDYLAPHFVGLRTADAMYRFFGTNAWGFPIGLSLHLFAHSVDGATAEKLWSAWLDALFASPPTLEGDGS